MLQITDYFLIFIAVCCAVKGFVTIFSGKIPEGESNYVSNFSEEGLKRYRNLSAVSNIAGCVFIFGLYFLKMFNIINGMLFTCAGIGGAVLILIVFLAVRKSCGKVGLSA